MNNKVYFTSQTFEVELDEEQKLKLERIYSSVRRMHNYFVTRTQKLSDDEIRRMNYTYMEFRNDFIDFVTSGRPEDASIAEVSEHILESHLYLISSAWSTFCTGKRARPMFIWNKSTQCFWMTEEEGIVIKHNALEIAHADGNIVVELPLEYNGTIPVCYRFGKEADGKYFLTFLYRSMSEPTHGEFIALSGGITENYLRVVNTRHSNPWTRPRRSCLKAYKEKNLLTNRTLTNRFFETYLQKRNPYDE